MLIDAESDSDDDSDDEGVDNDDDIIVEDVKDEDLDETPPAATPLPEMLGRGMRIRKKPTSYVPSTTGKKYELGVMNLCFRGTRYKLKDGVISVNVDPVVPQAPTASRAASVFDKFDTMLRCWD